MAVPADRGRDHGIAQLPAARPGRRRYRPETAGGRDMTRWARLYPRWWRERHGEEFTEVVSAVSGERRALWLAMDIGRGALDAHLRRRPDMKRHPLAPVQIPKPGGCSRPVGYVVAMRLHITLDDALVGDLDQVVGAGERSSFIAKAVRRTIDELKRADALEVALGSIPDSGHDWDTDPAAWVRAQRTNREQLAG